MVAQQGIHHDWQNILLRLSTQTIQEIENPTHKNTIHIREPTKPNEKVQKIYEATNCQKKQAVVRIFVLYHKK